MKKLIKTVTASTVLGLFLYSYLYFSKNGKLPSITGDFPNIVMIIGMSNLLGFCLYYFNHFLSEIQYLRKRNFVRILSGIILNYLLLVFLCFIILRFYVFTYTNNSYSGFYTTHAGSILRFYILAFVITFLFVLVDFSIRSYQQFELAKVMAVQLAREQIELQLDAFKLQLSPHYLFNNLNTLSHLVYQNAQTAEKYIRNLSKTYDYILKNSKLDLVLLQEELIFINAYSYLLNIRFQDSLSIFISSDKTKNNCLIPPLSLQLLVENAVKHNAASPEEKLKIEINLMNESIEVKNNLLKKPGNQQSLKIGLKNLKKRYGFFTDKPIKIIENKYFIVKIPLIKRHGNF